MHKYILEMNPLERKYIKNFITALLAEEYKSASDNLQLAVNAKIKAKIKKAGDEELFNN